MAFSAPVAYDIGDSPVKIADGVGTTDNVTMWRIDADNFGPNHVHVGRDNTIRSDNAPRLKAGGYMSYDHLAPGDEIWAVCAPGETARVAVLRIGV